MSQFYLDEREADIWDPAVHDVGHTGSLHAAQALPQVLRTRVTVAVSLRVLPAHTRSGITIRNTKWEARENNGANIRKFVSLEYLKGLSHETDLAFDDMYG